MGGCRLATGLMAAVVTGGDRADSVAIPPSHPRVMITPAMVKEMAHKVKGPMAAEYEDLKANTNIRWMERQWGTPGGLMECGLAYLIEREDAAAMRCRGVRCLGHFPLCPGFRLTLAAG